MSLVPTILRSSQKSLGIVVAVLNPSKLWIYSVMYLVVIIALFSACKKDKPIGPQCLDCSKDSLLIDTTVAQVFILNEGNYGWNNASISIYNTEDQSIQNNVYNTKNGVLIGDIVQSMEIINDKGYIMVNNSNKIEIINPNTIENIGTIENINSPRYIKQVSTSKAYVTSLYGDGIYVLDLDQNSIQKKIEVKGWTEQMAISGENAFVVSPDSNKIIIIDIVTDQVIKEINTTKFPNSIAVDKNKKIWVLCNGGYGEDFPELFRINPYDFKVELSLLFSKKDESPEDLVIDIYGEQLYYNNQAIYSLSIDQAMLPIHPLIEISGNNFYGLAISPNSELYVTDALDYTQAGYVFRYSIQGNAIDSFKVGIIPGSFCFN